MLAQQPRADLLARDARLQAREAARLLRAGVPDQHLAVEHGAVGQLQRAAGELGEALGDEFLAARPEPVRTAAAHELCTDAVVLPLDEPVVARPERGRIRGERVREIERVRRAAARRRRGVSRRDQRLEVGGAAARRDVGVADEPLRDELRVESRVLRERARHQQARDTDAKPAADELDQQEAPGRIELVGVGAQPRQRFGRREAAQRQHARLDPVREAEDAAARWRRQQVRDRLGEVADSLVALLEQPVGNAAGCEGELAQGAAVDDLARLAAGEEVDRPGGICRRHGGEIPDQRLDLGLRGRRRVEGEEQLGEAAHRRSIAGRAACGRDRSGRCEWGTPRARDHATRGGSTRRTRAPRAT